MPCHPLRCCHYLLSCIWRDRPIIPVLILKQKQYKLHCQDLYKVTEGMTLQGNGGYSQQYSVQNRYCAPSAAVPLSMPELPQEKGAKTVTGGLNGAYEAWLPALAAALRLLPAGLCCGAADSCVAIFGPSQRSSMPRTPAKRSSQACSLNQRAWAASSACTRMIQPDVW